MSIEKIIPVDKELVNIFGVNDQNLKYLKNKFKKIKINGKLIIEIGKDQKYKVIEILKKNTKHIILSFLSTQAMIKVLVY